ncbi:hypothetical protein NEFER03_0465 [Nematocida sp. LUAm3]|nr:hypothetical protein NEFER03_0465 [Nematocida sp. LUAm3]KAI5175922.1 hypothetical protein NEFER02_1782 [Nematocida sp. LUAm2]KAI5178696.1 hypothetical protein NEFER01_1815 [Nematocida sp. LUAm1]
MADVIVQKTEGINLAKRVRVPLRGLNWSLLVAAILFAIQKGTENIDKALAVTPLRIGDIKVRTNIGDTVLFTIFFTLITLFIIVLCFNTQKNIMDKRRRNNIAMVETILGLTGIMLLGAFGSSPLFIIIPIVASLFIRGRGFWPFLWVSGVGALTALVCLTGIFTSPILPVVVGALGIVFVILGTIGVEGIVLKSQGTMYVHYLMIVVPIVFLLIRFPILLVFFPLIAFLFLNLGAPIKTWLKKVILQNSITNSIYEMFTSKKSKRLFTFLLKITKILIIVIFILFILSLFTRYLQDQQTVKAQDLAQIKYLEDLLKGADPKKIAEIPQVFKEGRIPSFVLDNMDLFQMSPKDVDKGMIEVAEKAKSNIDAAFKVIDAIRINMSDTIIGPVFSSLAEVVTSFFSAIFNAISWFFHMITTGVGNQLVDAFGIDTKAPTHNAFEKIILFIAGVLSFIHDGVIHIINVAHSWLFSIFSFFWNSIGKLFDWNVEILKGIYGLLAPIFNWGPWDTQAYAANTHSTPTAALGDVLIGYNEKANAAVLNTAGTSTNDEAVKLLKDTNIISIAVSIASKGIFLLLGGYYYMLVNAFGKESYSTKSISIGLTGFKPVSTRINISNVSSINKYSRRSTFYKAFMNSYCEHSGILRQLHDITEFDPLPIVEENLFKEEDITAPYTKNGICKQVNSSYVDDIEERFQSLGAIYPQFTEFELVALKTLYPLFPKFSVDSKSPTLIRLEQNLAQTYADLESTKNIEKTLLYKLKTTFLNWKKEDLVKSLAAKHIKAQESYAEFIRKFYSRFLVLSIYFFDYPHKRYQGHVSNSVIATYNDLLPMNIEDYPLDYIHSIIQVRTAIIKKTPPFLTEIQSANIFYGPVYELMVNPLISQIPEAQEEGFFLTTISTQPVDLDISEKEPPLKVCPPKENDGFSIINNQLKFKHIISTENYSKFSSNLYITERTIKTLSIDNVNKDCVILVSFCDSIPLAVETINIDHINGCTIDITYPLDALQIFLKKKMKTIPRDQYYIKVSIFANQTSLVCHHEFKEI